jgi:uncharacterized protein YciW
MRGASFYMSLTAEITQYARQLASSPDVIDAKVQQQLDEVGLTARE